MTAYTVRVRDESPYYANVRVLPGGDVGVQVCRRVLWAGPRLGVGCNRPRPMRRLIHAARYDAPLHVVLDRVHLMLEKLED